MGLYADADATNDCAHGFLRTETMIIITFSEKLFNRQNKSIPTKFFPPFKAICTIL